MDVIHQGKSKRVYSDPDSESRVIIEFSNTVTAGDGTKREELEGKGQVVCDQSYYLLGFLEERGIDTHLVKALSGARLLCRKAEVIPIEVVCRNIAAGSFCRRYGVKKGTVLKEPLIELFLKDDSLSDPLITAEAAVNLNIIEAQDLMFIKNVTASVNYYLTELLRRVELQLVDFKLEFGKIDEGRIILADEISGDTMRIWDSNSSSLDKDVFREDKGDLVEVYRTLFKILSRAKREDIATRQEVIDVIVEPKNGIKNPPGEVTKKALTRLGFGEASEVRVGKTFRITMNRPLNSEVLKQLDLMSIRLLSNPISETHTVRV